MKHDRRKRAADRELLERTAHRHSTPQIHFVPRNQAELMRLLQLSLLRERARKRRSR